MKRILGIILSLCMLICILPTNVFAATQISSSDVSVNEPAVGEKPIAFASLFNQSLEAVNVEWVGALDANGCFMANTAYTVNITIRITAGQDKYLVNKEGGFRINRKKAVMTSLSDDKQQAVISYTFDNGASSAPVSEQAGTTPPAANTAEPIALKDANFYVQTPVQGEKPSGVITTDRNDVLDISAVKWTGDFDSDGCFIAKNTYRLHFNITIKDGVNFIIPSKGVESVRNYRVNGKLLTTGPVADNGKQFQASLNVEVQLPKEAVDMDYVYSRAEADANWYGVYPKYPTEIIVNEGENLLSIAGKFSVAQRNCVKKLVINYPFVSLPYSDAYIFAEYFPNLEELWLSQDADVGAFFSDYTQARFGVSGDDLLMPFDSLTADTQKLTVFISDFSIKGFTNELTMGADGLLYRENDLHKRFKTRLYSGDVMEAYQKGPDSAYEWCTNHDYSELIYTADRVCIMKTCEDIVTYYYSCSKCGKCEYNPNHTGLVNPNYTFHLDRQLADHCATVRNLSEKYFIGVNSRGERAYWKSCVICGVTHGEVLYGYQQPANGEWEAEQATAEKDSVYAFAVRGDRYVTAKMSQWAQNDVQWASQNGILDLNLLGGDYTKPITRLQFASIAVKLAEVLAGKAIAPAEAGTFADTDNEYALKAYASGITSGVSATEFAPNGTLTRQQMATFIHRALMYVRDNTNIRYTIYTPELEKYSDSWAIADWAKIPMEFMNALGLVKGISDTAIDPDGKCTIEQAAVVANRSVNADQIGWYQATGEGTYCHADTEHAPTQATYYAGHRIWVDAPQSGGQKAYEHPDYDKFSEHRGWMQTVYPFKDIKAWVESYNFRPIKDLKADDEANFNKFYNK